MDPREILQEPNWWAVFIAAVALIVAIGSLLYTRSSSAAAKASAIEAKRANDLTEKQLNKHQHPWEVTERTQSRTRIRNSSDATMYEVIINSPNGEESSRDMVEGWGSIDIDTSMHIGQTAGDLIVRYQMGPEEEAKRYRWGL